MNNNNSTVAKNTVILYFRMILTLCVSLYTSRVILKSLGVIDYGVYNVVGGILACMSFMLQSLVVSFQRFFCKYIPSKDYSMLSKIFGSALVLVCFISTIVIILVETIGVWFLNNKLTIPSERMYAANVVLQLSILVFIISLFQAIYNSVIISFEKMNVYAYISIFDVTMKLLVAWIISIIAYDKLIAYSILLAFVAISSFLLYFIYVTKKYNYIKPAINIKQNQGIIRELFNFSGMSMIGTISHVAKNTGFGFLLNIFFGPALNTARAISFQIYTAVSSFTQSFQTAFSPNMMKQYETGSLEEIEKTLYGVSKYSFFAMFLLSYPIMVAISPILSIWLGSENVPGYTSIFSIIILCIGLIETLANPIVNIVYAKGKINGFMTALSIVVFSSLPLAFVMLQLGWSPIVVYVIDLITILSAQIVRIYFIHKLFSFKYYSYFKYIIKPILGVLLVSGVLWNFSIRFANTNSCLLLSAFISEFIVCVSILYIGLTKTERNFISSKIKTYAFRIFKHH